MQESGNLAVQVAFMLLNDNQLTLSEVERRSRIEECVRVVYQILLRCRHKGAIEAASESMGLLCRHLFASKIESIRTVPRNALMEFLNRLESTQSGASVTRRSAGLVFLVVKIVSSEPGDKSSKVPITIRSICLANSFTKSFYLQTGFFNVFGRSASHFHCPASSNGIC